MIFSPKRYRYRNMRKSNLNYNQAKRKYPNLNPFGDADRDGVMNMFDCRPFNRRKQDESIIVEDKSWAKTNKIKDESSTNCPKCGKKKPFKYRGWCPDCTYPEQ